MIRRSRISVRPNVRPAGRAAAPASDGPQLSQEKSELPQTSTDNVQISASEVKTNSAVKSPEKICASSSETADKSNNQGTVTDATSTTKNEGTQSCEASVSTTAPASGTQRRKRFTVLPNLAKPRAAPAPTRTSARIPKSPIKPVTPEEPVISAAPIADSIPKTQLPTEAKSPLDVRASGRRRPSGGKHSKAQSKSVDASLVRQSAEAATQDKGAGPLDISESTNQKAESSTSSKAVLSEPTSINLPQVLETPASPLGEELPTKVPPEKDALALTEKTQASLSPEITPLMLSSLTSHTLNDPSDLLRLAKARKLRELLKKEMNKDKGHKPKLKKKACKSPKDHTKMTMRDLIYYLPENNPMRSFTDEVQRGTETILPASPRAGSPDHTAEPEETGEADGGERIEEEDRAAPGAEPDQEEPLLVPRVKVAEDGTLIIDEESLTVEVLRTKRPNPAEEKDPIFERGSTTTYSSFRKGTYTKPWSNKETDMFFLAISMVGTDFSMIGQLFPHRARIEIKNKFKKEERANSWRIDKAFKEKRRLDLDFFNSLLEKILAEEEKKKRQKKKLEVKVQRASEKTQRENKRKELSSGSEEEDEEEEEEEEDSDAMEGEKENEDLLNDGRSTPSPKKRKKKSREDGEASPKKRKITSEAADVENIEEDEFSISDEQLAQERTNMSELSNGHTVKAVQFKGWAQKPVPNLDHRQGKRGLTLQKTGRSIVTSVEEKTELSNMLGGQKERREAAGYIALMEEEDEPDVTTVQEHILNKPTRSGRIPKLSKHVLRATEEEEDEELSPLSPSAKGQGRGSKGPNRRSKIKPVPTQNQDMPRRGKSKLVTLRASATEEEEGEEEDEISALEDDRYLTDPEKQNQAPAFVPLSLRSRTPVDMEVEETMEELEISVNVPDGSAISQHGLGSDATCERVHMPVGIVPCEHQLDLLVDVIEYMCPENMEVSEESYNEAARTLLTIGKSAQKSQEAGEQTTEENDDIIVEQTSTLVHQEVVHQEEVVSETISQSEVHTEACQVVQRSLSDSGVSDLDLVVGGTSVPEHLPPPEDLSHVQEPIRTQDTVINNSATTDGSSVISKRNIPQSRRNCLPKAKPNLGHGSRVMRTQTKQRLSESGNSQSENADVSQHVIHTSKESTPEGPATASICPEDSVLENSKTVPTLQSQSVTSHTVGVRSEKGQEDAEEERLQLPSTHSAGDSQIVPSSSECLMQPPPPTKRTRLPRPKPNVGCASRTISTRNSTEPSTVNSDEEVTVEAINNSSFTATQAPVGGTADHSTSYVSQCEPDRHTEIPVTTTPAQPSPDALTEKPSGNVSEKLSGGRLSEDMSSVLEEVSSGNTEDVTGSDPAAVSADISLPAVSTSDEPVFILSLTEIPPSLVEESEVVTELPFTATSDLQSEPHTDGMKETDHEKLSHAIVTDTLVCLTEDGKEADKRKGSTAEQHVEPSLISGGERKTEESKQEDNRRKLTERTRRAKIQVKPNPVSRRGIRSVQSKEITPQSSSFKESALPIIPSQKTPPCASLWESAALSISSERSAQESTTTDTSRQESLSAISAHETTPHAISQHTVSLSVQTLSEPSCPATTQSQSTSHTKAPENPASEEVSESAVGQRDPSGRASNVPVIAGDLEAGGTGAESQTVPQITPPTTTGPLTRPGRRPRGFLSFISNKSTQGAKPVLQRPQISTSRPERKRATPVPSSRHSRLNPSSASTQPSTSKFAPASKTSFTETPRSSAEKDEEPTSVSEYFFNDIFTEVDDLEEMDC
ncbi:transcription factor TFIIIB component B'' homolog [Chanos chanos]|uniref:Transcription factor TFIIIB component B'' homolog n=1 Tax=Chanos chanos TaxID=29144 RepID=A0A6J2UWW0_CHACN|nr:transcription factor TFIIIB component B'' homolog [Chanos chanos]